MPQKSVWAPPARLYDASSHVSCGGRQRGRRAYRNAVTARSPISAADAAAVAGSVLAFKRAGSTVFGRLDVLAAATSGAPHYFFSQIDDKLSRLPGRLAVSVHRETSPGSRPAGDSHRADQILVPTPRSFTSPPSRRIRRTRLASTRATSRSVKPPSRSATCPPRYQVGG